VLEQAVSIFDSIGGKFLARLREISSSTRNTSDGKATITFKTVRIEAKLFTRFCEYKKDFTFDINLISLCATIYCLVNI